MCKPMESPLLVERHEIDGECFVRIATPRPETPNNGVWLPASASEPIITPIDPITSETDIGEPAVPPWTRGFLAIAITLLLASTIRNR